MHLTTHAMLIKNDFKFSLHWSRRTHCSKGCVLLQSKATSKTKISLSKSEFELAKKSYLKGIKKAVADAKIPAELEINWDQTGVNVVPASQWTQKEKGSHEWKLLESGINAKLRSQ